MAGRDARSERWWGKEASRNIGKVSPKHLLVSLCEQGYVTNMSRILTTGCGYVIGDYSATFGKRIQISNLPNMIHIHDDLFLDFYSLRNGVIK